MEGTPLDRAYTSAKAADAAVLAGNFSKAAEQFADAAAFFKQVKEENPETASARTSQALAEQHESLAEYFSSGRAAEDVKRHMRSPSSSTYHNPNTTNNANGGGLTPVQHKTLHVNTSSHHRTNSGGSMSSPMGASRNNTFFVAPQTAPSSPSIPNTLAQISPLSSAGDEAINSLATKSAAVFARTFDNVIASKLGMPMPVTKTASHMSSGGPIGASNMVSDHVSTSSAQSNPTQHKVAAQQQAALSSINNNAPSESFYLVKPKVQKPSFAKQSLNALAQARAPNKGHPSERGMDKASVSASATSGVTVSQANGTGLSNGDRAEAIERAMNAQKECLKSGLQQIVHLVLQNEEQLRDEQLGEIDQLRAENDRLKIQVSKLKARWEDSKESARKRQIPTSK